MSPPLILDFDFDELEEKLSLDSKTILLGSCFSENIGNKLRDNKFEVLINPFGTLYNPISIFETIKIALGNQTTPDRPIERDGIWLDWSAHSEISGLTELELNDNFKQASDQTKEFCLSGDWIIITPGTSIVYEFADGRIVANCHKFPQKNFRKRELTELKILTEFQNLHTQVKSSNPKLNWLFTISPVRHIRDGLIANNRSKAILNQAVHKIVEEFPNCHYFPSYEIVTDELRDYRFYGKDLVHPNEIAIDYVWQRMIEETMDSETKNFIKEWSAVRSSLWHKPKNPTSSGHQNFLQKTIKKVESFSGQVDVTSELESLKKQLI